MSDPLGVRRKDPQEPSATAAPHGSHRLWAFLLLLDSIFVMVFGGVVASKIYRYWRAPAPSAVPPPRRHPLKTAEALKTTEAAASTTTAPAKPVEPPKAAEAPKPAPRPEPAKAAAARADAPRPPKPSLLNEPPKPHAAPALAGASAAALPPAPQATEGKAKAAPVVFKLRATNAKSVQLVGAFIVHGGRKEMARDADGMWSVKLYLNRGQYRYFFAVDKKKTLDPENPQSDRGASLLSVQ